MKEYVIQKHEAVNNEGSRRWVVLIAGVVIQTVLGGIYVWSIFVPYLTDNYGLSNTQCGSIFGIMIAVFTLAAIPAGRLLKRYGPRLIAGIGTVLFSLGYFLASFSNGDFLIMVITLGIISGAGIGFAYVCPLTVGMKWFPRHKGLVTGVSVAGFGAGALLFNYVAGYFLHSLGWDVLLVLRFIAVVIGGTAILASLFISEPKITKDVKHTQTILPLKAYIYSGTFLIIFLSTFAGTFAGLLTVSKLKPIILNMGIDTQYAVWSVSFFAVGNAMGRIIWGKLYDIFGPRRTIIASLSMLGISLAPLLINNPSVKLVLVTSLLIGIGFGACFVVYAGSIVYYYGVDLFPRLYPICFLGYGLAGVTGPSIAGWIVDSTGSYNAAIILSMVLIFAMTFIVLKSDSLNIKGEQK